MASRRMDQAEIENCISLARDMTDNILPVPDLDSDGEPEYFDTLRHQDLLSLRHEAFAQVLKTALDTDIS